MATAATSLLGLALPVTGELSGTWGDTVNVSITALLDSAVAGTTTLSSDADVTLTTTTLAANQARQAIILWTAGGTATRTITAPAQSKSYIVINKTSSSQSIKIVGAGPTTGVTIVAGTAAFVVWNGVDFVTASVTSTTGILPVANGGTGLASGTSGGVLAYTATGTLASSAALAASALVIGGGAGAAPSTTTTGTGVVTALGVNVGTAGAFVVNGGALGSPSSVGTMPAFTLGGTIAGGGNQINNVVIGTTTPLAGAFTTVTASGNISGDNAILSGDARLPSTGKLSFNGATASDYIIGPTSGTINSYIASSLKTSLTSTGLAVTGTLSATGAITGAAGSFSTITATGSIQGQASNAFTTSSNSGQYYHFDNASGSNFMGLSAANVVDLYAGGALSATFRSTGLAVTGTLSSTLGATIEGLTVGLGGNAIPTNTAVGYQALLNNTTGQNNNSLGYQAGLNISTGSYNVIIGSRSASSGATRITGDAHTLIGEAAGYALQGAALNNTFLGQNSGSAITTGGNNTILGRFDGNGGGLDIRTASNYIVLADGGANPRAYWNGANATFNGALALTGTLSGGTSGTAYSFSGSAPATSLTLNSSGDLGINTAPAYKLHVVKGSAGITARFTDGDGTTDVYGYGLEITRSIAYIKGSSALHLGSAAGYSAVVLDSAGNLGLGVTPSAWGTAFKVLQLANGTSLSNNGQTSYYQLGANNYFDGSDYKYIASNYAGFHRFSNAGAYEWHIAPSGTAGNTISFTQAMSLLADGNLLVGQTSGGIQDSYSYHLAIDGTLYQSHATGSPSGRPYNYFGYAGTNIGSITQNGTTAVAYNTSSDYRLKNTIAPMTGALAKVALLKPCTYKWNVNGSDGEGFIAHELAEVVPQCVTGEKDAVNEDGSIKSQGIDTSFLVATLTAAIQELKAEFDAYKASHP